MKRMQFILYPIAGKFTLQKNNLCLLCPYVGNEINND